MGPPKKKKRLKISLTERYSRPIMAFEQRLYF